MREDLFKQYIEKLEQLDAQEIKHGFTLGKGGYLIWIGEQEYQATDINDGIKWMLSIV